MLIYYTDHFVLPLPPGHRFPMRKYADLRARVAAVASDLLRVPAARLTPQPDASALRHAATVAPAERRDRSTIAGDHGNPMRFCARSSSAPRPTAAT